jgi:arabinogalactan oligomer/maltooligosaccharide transport system permease protein
MRSIRRVAAQVLIHLLLAVLALYVLLPLWGMARLAFDGSLVARPTEFRLLPKVWSFEPMRRVLDKPYQSVEFEGLLRNSLYVSVGAAVFAVILGISLAYAFARFRFPGRRVGMFILLLTALLPPIAFTTPLYIVLSILKLRTSLLGLTLVYAAFAMPFCIWNMRAAFQAIPKELEEAAFLDGASNLRTLAMITMPLALPSIAVAALIAFLMAYSEFAIGWLFVDRAETVTLAMAIYSIVQTGSAQPWNILGSLTLVMSAPVVVVFLILQRTLLERLSFGESKA